MVGGKAEEGVVASVSWHLQAIEGAPQDLPLEGEPLGSVTLVHVVCRPVTEVLLGGFGSAEIDETTTAQGPPEHGVWRRANLRRRYGADGPRMADGNPQAAPSSIARPARARWPEPPATPSHVEDWIVSPLERSTT